MITDREKEILHRCFNEIESPDWYVGMMALYIARHSIKKSVDEVVNEVNDLFNDFEKYYGELNQESIDKEMLT